MEQLEYVVNECDEDRIDKFLSLNLPALSRSYIQKLIKNQQVTVNDAVVKANYFAVQNDQVKIIIPELTEPDILPENIPLDILYEDDDLLVINKPKGMVVHPSAGHYTGTLVNALMYYCRGNLSGINGVLRPGIVHRIDMDTTGSIIVCKNDMAHQDIARQLKEHSIMRKYHAIVHGCVKYETGTINGPIGRHMTDRKKMSIHTKNGKSAVTHYKVLQRFPKFTYVECELETGRTHQIRVHMASIHHPLLGDIVYGPGGPGFNLQGQTLHAKFLGIVHPRTKEYLEIDTPLPEYFLDLLKRL